MTTEADSVLSEWFDIYPMGIKLKDPFSFPPIEAIDVLGYNLAINTDSLKWHIGAWCNHYIDFYGSDVYHQKAGIVKRKPQTIEVWAYVERNVPDACRVKDVTFECHRLVASIKDYKKQRIYLRLCRLFCLKHYEFENWLKERGLVEMSQPKYQDRLFDAEKAAYEVEVKRQEAEAQAGHANQRIAQLEAQLENALEGQIEAVESDSDDLPTYVDNALASLKNYLQVDSDDGFESVTVFANGSILWTPRK